MIDYKRFISPLSAKRRPDAIRETISVMKDAPKDMVFLGGGLPSSSLFPFKECSIKLEDGSYITLEGQCLNNALQYAPTPGCCELLDQLKSLVMDIHSPPCWDQTDMYITPGAQDAIFKAFEMVLKPGDYLILQEPVYPGALSCVKPYDLEYICVESDSKGMKPDSLLSVLSCWSPTDEYRPKVMYVIPNACNPTGNSLTAERKREIYRIASEYDILILEDDPYYFLQFEDLKNYAPSFLSLDVDGRVIRFDSFSKIVSPGIRLGFVTGPKPLIERMTVHLQVTLLHTTQLTQVIVSELLKKWGREGFFEHIKTICDFYRNKRDIMLEAANKYLKGLCEWSIPEGGLFLWIKVTCIDDTNEMITEKALSKKIMVIPGKPFFCDPNKVSNHLRAAFSTATPEEINRGMKSLKELIEEEIQINKQR